MPNFFPRFGLVVALAFTGTISRADDDDQDRAQQAFERGEIHSLDQVLDVVRKKMPGDVVKVELEHEHGSWVYEFKVLDAQGTRHEIEIDASSLRVLESD